ncbi:MAG: glycoside hydrolase family 3 C-terminal domain-containing protein [Bacteroidota bacterium]
MRTPELHRRCLAIAVTLLISLSVSLPSRAQTVYRYPFENPDLGMEERIDNLLSLMTLDEKVACLGTDPSVPRLGVKGARHVEGLHGLAQGGPSNWGSRNPTPTTIFPQAIGLAETWDPEALRKVAGIEAYETRYLFQNEHFRRGGLVVRAPNADLGRDPRWGRTEECYGEDAWFNGHMVVAFVKGLQGDDPDYWMTASLMKHFLANSNENGRDSSSSDFDERLFREYYSYPFYKGVTEGGSRAYMASYNAVNGIPMTVSPILKNITVKEWGQNGIICTDGGAYGLLQTAHKSYSDPFHAAEACLDAGINQFLDNYVLGVYGALANGYLSEADLDEALRGVFRVMIKLGQLDPPDLVPYRKIGITDSIAPWLTRENRNAVLEVTRESIVLLKNQDQLLPLDRKKNSKIAVIGPWADTVLLDWYSGTPPYYISPLQGIISKTSGYSQVSFARDNSFNKAVEIARNADIAIVVVGNHTTGNAGWAKCPVPSDGKEAVDRKVLELEQEDLIRRIYAVNPNTIIVLISSFPYSINWTWQNIPAIVHMTHCSQEQGSALADVLFGDYNPAGRLVQTWPSSTEVLPPMMDYNIRNGRTYMYAKEKPLFPFGYGLSYTTFEYSNLRCPKEVGAGEEEFTVLVDIRNTGTRDGDEVVQLYASYPGSAVERPLKELRGFKRVHLQSGEKLTVPLVVKKADLAYWDTGKNSFVVEQGTVRLMVGSSSEDIKLKGLTRINL